MSKFLGRVAEIIGEFILAAVTLATHIVLGMGVMALPAIAHPYTHWLYGDAPPMLVGTLSLPDAIHTFDYAVAFGIMGAGGLRAIVNAWSQ